MKYSLILAISCFLISSTPVFAQNPDDDFDFYDEVVRAMEPLRQQLEDFTTLINGDTISGTTTSIWGVQLFSSSDTGQGVTETTPPPGYYVDAPEEIRQSGYTLEGLSSRDLSQMSVFDFVAWLGHTIALPIIFVRGLTNLVSTLGPIGIFLSWLFLAMLWVAIIHFISFMISLVRFIVELVKGIFAAIELFTP